jgi:hypothetical protein
MLAFRLLFGVLFLAVGVDGFRLGAIVDWWWKYDELRCGLG